MRNLIRRLTHKRVAAEAKHDAPDQRHHGLLLDTIAHDIANVDHLVRALSTRRN